MEFITVEKSQLIKELGVYQQQQQQISSQKQEMGRPSSSSVATNSRVLFVGEMRHHEDF